MHPAGAWGFCLRAIGPGVTARFLPLLHGRGQRPQGPNTGGVSPSEVAAWASAVSRSESVQVSTRDMGLPSDRPSCLCLSLSLHCGEGPGRWLEAVRHRALGDTQPFSLSTCPLHMHTHTYTHTHSSPVASDLHLTLRKGTVSLANPLSASPTVGSGMGARSLLKLRNSMAQDFGSRVLMDITMLWPAEFRGPLP